MKKNEMYNNKQKDEILKVLKKQQKEFTIKEIYNTLKDKAGLTTIYRLIDNLVEEGIVTKNISKENITYYQYLDYCNENNHFYLKCEHCGTMIHIDCNCIVELSNHILKEHKFKMNKEHIIIKGLCEKCINQTN